MFNVAVLLTCELDTATVSGDPPYVTLEIDWFGASAVSTATIKSLLFDAGIAKGRVY